MMPGINELCPDCNQAMRSFGGYFHCTGCKKKFPWPSTPHYTVEYKETIGEPVKKVTHKGRCRCAECGNYEFNVLQKADEHGVYNEVVCAKCGVNMPFVKAEVR